MGDIPTLVLTDAPPTSRQRYEASDKGHERQRRYSRTDGRKAQRTACRVDDYLRRDVVAWDGEGVTNADGSHDYIMLAGRCSTGHGVYRQNESGLSTAECFETLINFSVRTSSLSSHHLAPVHVIYGGGYDFNMMFRDLSRRHVLALYKTGYVLWGGYRIGWRRGKELSVRRVADNASVRIYDVMPFFQCAFVKACDEYLGNAFVQRDMVVANKAARGSFTVDDILHVKEYNDAELVNLIALFRELRERLSNVGIRPSRWDGPGAIASVLLKQRNIKAHMAECPAPVAEAARFAYAGGRFEVIRYGSVDAPCYEYDVNSAYPSALRHVPSLAHGKWVHHDNDCGSKNFALYHIRADYNDMDLPGPLFRRDRNGTICYPLHTMGWYWSPEYDVWNDYRNRFPGKATGTVTEVWEYVPDDPTVRPFAFIEDLYRLRQELKARGDGAQVGLKLGLNSLYGKLAQQVGWRTDDKGNVRKPPFHQLEWAGYATSHCRATVLRAVLLQLDSVIAFETDAVFTSEPLPVPLGDALGEFKETRFNGLTYCQSGVYFAVDDKGVMVNRTRGVDRDTLTLDHVQRRMGGPVGERVVETQLTRFIGAGIALSQSWRRWRRWETLTKTIKLMPTGKRVHLDCAACDDEGFTLGTWHSTMCPMLNRAHSRQYPVEWVNPDPQMSELEEMRREVADCDV